MPRDYKNVGGKPNGKAPARLFPALSFFSGLSIGLLIAFVVYMYYHRPHADAATAQPPTAQGAAPEGGGAASKSGLPRPTFDFYKILPSREVNVSEWVAEDHPAAAPSAPGPVAGATAPAPAAGPGEIYILQVGSFRTEEAADQIKARLALLGITAEVQRVVLSGQDAVLRVRIGPFRSPEKFEEMRQRLDANGIDFMVLKLKVDGAQPGEG